MKNTWTNFRRAFPPVYILASSLLHQCCHATSYAGAWATKARHNDGLISGLKDHGILVSKRVENAMRAVDRGDFTQDLSTAYFDQPQSIGYGQTISAPHIHAIALQALESNLHEEGARVLDVGSGSGYLTACFAHMVQPTGRVVGLELSEMLVQWSKQNLKKHHQTCVCSGLITLLAGDGWKGCPSLGPFDVIHVGAAAVSMPEALVQQLKPGGRMIIPIGDALSSEGRGQILYQVDKDASGRISMKKLMDVAYVPLVKTSDNI